MFKKAFVILLIIPLIAVLSCSNYQKVVKSADNEYKFEKAVEYFEKGDFYRSLMLFEQLNMIYRGTGKAQELTYYLAYCYYEQQDYLLASYYFKRYAKSYPNADRAEECLFMNAYCYYLDSPKFSLDQSNTYEALTELQLFVDQFPQSDRVEQANELIDELRAKLEQKNFEIAELYYKMQDYQAAITSLENILKDFPDSQHKEQILYYILKSYYNYAQNSIKDKQKDRFVLAVESFNTLIITYPETEFLKDAHQVHRKSKEALEEL